MFNAEFHCIVVVFLCNRSDDNRINLYSLLPTEQAIRKFVVSLRGFNEALLWSALVLPHMDDDVVLPLPGLPTILCGDDHSCIHPFAGFQPWPQRSRRDA